MNQCGLIRFSNLVLIADYLLRWATVDYKHPKVRGTLRIIKSAVGAYSIDRRKRKERTLEMRKMPIVAPFWQKKAGFGSGIAIFRKKKRGRNEKEWAVVQNLIYCIQMFFCCFVAQDSEKIRTFAT